MRVSGEIADIFSGEPADYGNSKYTIKCGLCLHVSRGEHAENCKKGNFADISEVRCRNCNGHTPCLPQSRITKITAFPEG